MSPTLPPPRPSATGNDAPPAPSARVKTSPAPGSHQQRVADLAALMKVMASLSRPTTIDPAPTPQSLADPAHLAKAAADSATKIAYAAAALGMPDVDNDAQSKILWDETLCQIRRVQDLYGLGPLPFQPPK